MHVDVVAGLTTQLWCGPAGSRLSGASNVFHPDTYVTLDLVR